MISNTTTANTVAIIGAGYVGLVTAACFARAGLQVVLVEKSAEKRLLLEEGKAPFFEPHLDELVLAARRNHSIVIIDSIDEMISHKPEIIFSCVGTPSLSDGSVDMTAVWDVVHEFADRINYSCIFINKSTVPVGTAHEAREIIVKKCASRGLDITVAVASNPEFLREGSAVLDSMQPDRVVVGASESFVFDKLYTLYRPFIKSDDQFITMNCESAELTKYAANTMLALRISFMNQVAQFAALKGADINAVKQGIGIDPRIGSQFLNAGIGYGGSCFPKDVKALIDMGKKAGVPMTIAQEVEVVNNRQPHLFVAAVDDYYAGNLIGKTIGIWGLSFKPNTDDIRCAPALAVISELLHRGASLIVYDPQAMKHVKAIYKDSLIYASDSREVLDNADALLVITEWPEFIATPPAEFTKLRDKVVFDGRLCLNNATLESVGVSYWTFGFPPLGNSPCSLGEEQSFESLSE